jgi:hypothetical protein
MYVFWYFTGKLYSKEGKFFGMSPTLDEKVLMFLPVLNTLFSIFLWVWWKEPTEDDDVRIKRFFNIK